MNSQSQRIIGVALIVSFCSICYELLLAQALSAFLENTVLRYSVTLGLYMFALGLGARTVEGKVLDFPIGRLLRIEIILTLVGGSLIFAMHAVDHFIDSRMILSLFAHALIIIIGFLSGMELPLLMDILKEDRRDSESLVLGVSYIGAVIGTIVFAFIFYPKLGLLTTSLIVGALNGIAGVLLNFCKNEEQEFDRTKFFTALYIQLSIFVVISICLIFSSQLNEFLLNLYLSKGLSS